MTRRRAAVLLVALAALWLLVGAVSAYGAYRDLSTARGAVNELRDVSLDGDMQPARAALDEAAGAFERARDRLGGFAAAPLHLLPVVGDDVTVLEELAAAGAAATQAGLSIADAVLALPAGADGLSPTDGRLPVEAYDSLADPLEQAAALLRRADDHVERTRRVSVVGEVADARREVSERLPGVTAAVQRGAALIDVLPGFLGADGSRRYLFLAQNPAEARGTGGFIGAYSVLTVTDGALSFSAFDEIQELPAYHVSQVIAPSEEYARRYNRYGAAGFWHNINMTPDFPTAARAMLSLYEKGTGERLDGVIATDPFALQLLIAVAGPVEVPGVGRVEAEDVVDVVTNRAHAEFADSQRRKRVLGAVAVGAFDGLLDGTSDTATVLQALAAAATGGHILLRSDEADEQAAFLRADVAGALHDPAGDFLAVIANSGSATKLDYYIDRTITYDVQLRADGSADSAVTIEFDSAAPADGVSHRVIGPNVEDLSAGEQRLIVSTYAQDGAQLGVVAGADAAVDEDVELGHPVFTSVTTVPPGEATTLSLAWERPRAWQRHAGAGAYRLTVQRQVTVPPTRVVVTVTPPPGMVAAAIPGSAEVRGGVVRVDDAGREDLVVDLTFTAATDRR